MSRKKYIYIKQKNIKKKSYYSPVFSDLGGGYEGANNNRQFRLWNYVSGVVDSEILTDLPVLRARCRDVYRNSAYGRAPIQTLVSNVIGQGIFLQSNIDRKILSFLSEQKCSEIEDDIERKFSSWAESKDCDASRQSCFYDLQFLGKLSYAQSGEFFTLLPILKRNNKNQLCLQILEADLISNKPGQFNTPTCKDGIEQNNYGEPLSYSIQKDVFNWETVPARGEKTDRPNIIHYFRQERPGQSRGIPLLTSVLEIIKQIDRYSKQHLINTIVQGLFSVFIKSNNPNVLDNLIPNTAESITSESKLSDSSFDYQLAPGSVHHLEDNESIDFANPASPNSQFNVFIDSHLAATGMATNIPFEMLKKQFNSSYSASRAARLEAWRYFLIEREKFNRDWNQIIFREWLTIEVLEGRIDCPGFFDSELIKNAYCQASWLGSTMGQVDETKEVQAAIMRMENRLSTHTEETRKLTGMDFKQNMDITKREESILGNLQAIKSSGNIQEEQFDKDNITAEWILNNAPELFEEIKKMEI